MRKTVKILIFLVISASGLFAQQIDYNKLTGKYFGQNPPGTTPEIFAKDIVSLNESTELRCLIWDDGIRILLNRSNAGFLESELKDGRWLPFTKTSIFGNHDHMQENISPNGKKIVFNKFIRNPDVRGGMEVQIWKVEKNGANWETPYYTGINGMYPYCDKYDNLYYTTAKDGHNCIGISYYQNNNYSKIAVVPAALCTTKYFTHPCADPDGNWIIFNTEGNNYTENGSRMFISFKKTDGEWTEAVSMGTYLKGAMLINVSTDGKYLFYAAKGDIYWVSAKIIEELKPKELK